jgi:predicted  nucleic acid-binding Zn-ribbon protein
MTIEQVDSKIASVQAVLADPDSVKMSAEAFDRLLDRQTELKDLRWLIREHETLLREKADLCAAIRQLRAEKRELETLLTETGRALVTVTDTLSGAAIRAFAKVGV